MQDLARSYLEVVAWVGLPILLGIALRSRLGAPRAWSRRLFDLSFYGCYTPIMVLSVWIARTAEGAAWLPILALSGWLLAAAVGFAASLALGHGPRQRGAFVCSMCQSNVGFTLLGLIALALFGEAGLAQAAYTQLLYTPFYLLFCFPVARAYGQAKTSALARVLLENLSDPRVWVPLAAMAAGLLLNLSGVPRPAWCARVTAPAIYFGAALAGVAIGLLYGGLKLRRYARENLISFAYRSSLYPLYYAGAAALAGLGGVDARVLVLYGLVPSGLLANVLALYFDLDTELTSSIFMLGTAAFLLGVLPIYTVLATR